MTRDQRCAAIIATALEMANARKLSDVDYHKIAAVVPVPTSARLIRYHFGKKETLFRAVATHKDAAPHVVAEARIMGIIAS